MDWRASREFFLHLLARKGSRGIHTASHDFHILELVEKHPAPGTLRLRCWDPTQPHHFHICEGRSSKPQPSGGREGSALLWLLHLDNTLTQESERHWLCSPKNASTVLGVG